MKFWGGGVGCSGCAAVNCPCLGNGEVLLGFGSGPYVGMGFAVFLIFLVVEIFGSPFARNTMVIWGLLGGYAIAAMSSYEGAKFVTTDRVSLLTTEESFSLNLTTFTFSHIYHTTSHQLIIHTDGE